MSAASSRTSRAANGIALVGLALAAVGSSSRPAGSVDEPWIDTTDRDRVVAAYREEVGAEIPPLGWASGDRRCDPGTSSPASREATLSRVNYYRAMAGVVAAVIEDPGLTTRAQRAAMMMSAEGELSHSPSASFACFTREGQEAAANSNLYLGRNGPSAVDGYIEDPGETNTDVGHRVTILHPPTREMGIGDVGRSAAGLAANALWVFDERVFDEGATERQPLMRERDRFVAWPPRGYVPADLVHPRWSFTMGGVDLSGAQVAMYRPWAAPGDREIPLEIVDRVGAPGHVPLPTIVWEPEIEPDPATDTLYLVIVSGVRPHRPAGWQGPEGPATARERAFAYPVRVLGASPGPELTAAELLGWVEPA